jgi:hypothetical protein
MFETVRNSGEPYRDWNGPLGRTVGGTCRSADRRALLHVRRCTMNLSVPTDPDVATRLPAPRPPSSRGGSTVNQTRLIVAHEFSCREREMPRVTIGLVPAGSAPRAGSTVVHNFYRPGRSRGTRRSRAGALPPTAPGNGNFGGRGESGTRRGFFKDSISATSIHAASYQQKPEPRRKRWAEIISRIRISARKARSTASGGVRSRQPGAAIDPRGLPCTGSGRFSSRHRLDSCRRDRQGRARSETSEHERRKGHPPAPERKRRPR